MGFAETVLLGAIAGFTIYLGLPFGRIEHVDDRVRVALAMFSVGILAFIFMDVTSHGQEIVATRARPLQGSPGELRPRARPVRAARRSASPPARPGSPPASARVRRRGAARPVIAGGATDGIALAATDALEARRRALQTGMTIAGRDRPAQLRRGARDRRLGAGRGDRPRDGPDHRLRRPQRDRGVRDRRAARLDAPVLALARRSPASSAAARRSSAPSSATRSTRPRSSWPSTRSPAARSCT